MTHGQRGVGVFQNGKVRGSPDGICLSVEACKMCTGVGLEQTKEWLF